MTCFGATRGSHCLTSLFFNTSHILGRASQVVPPSHNMENDVLWCKDGLILPLWCSKTLGGSMGQVWEAFFGISQHPKHHSMPKFPESIGALFSPELAMCAPLGISNDVLCRKEGRPLLLRCSKTLGGCMDQVWETSAELFQHLRDCALIYHLPPTHDFIWLLSYSQSVRSRYVQIPHKNL